jgi:hypothetical protein
MHLAGAVDAAGGTAGGNRRLIGPIPRVLESLFAPWLIIA